MTTNGSNGFDPQLIKQHVGAIEGLIGDLDALKAEHMRKCKAVREDIKIAYDEAREAGIPKKPLKAEVKARLLERKADFIRSSLDEEDFATAESIAAALGDFVDSPLGAAAVRKAKPAGKVTLDDKDTLDDLTA